MTKHQLRCQDCAALTAGDNNEWICDELGKPCNTIETCPEELPLPSDSKTPDDITNITNITNMEDIKRIAKETEDLRKACFFKVTEHLLPKVKSNSKKTFMLSSNLFQFGIPYATIKTYLTELGYEQIENKFEVSGEDGDYWDLYRATPDAKEKGYPRTLSLCGTMSNNNFFLTA